MKKLALLFVGAAFLLNSCGSEEKKEDKKDADKNKVGEDSAEVLSFSLNQEQVTVNFTAYKYEEKTGVNGSFSEVQVMGGLTSENPLEVINGARISIPVASLVTKNEDRDAKIKESFFGTMVNTANITGVVNSVEGDKAMMIMTMNEIEFDVEGTISLEGDKLIVDAKIDVTNWNGLDAIAALNVVCEALHKKDDGKSVLWPTVTIKIETQLNVEYKK